MVSHRLCKSQMCSSKRCCYIKYSSLEYETALLHILKYGCPRDDGAYGISDLDPPNVKSVLQKICRPYPANCRIFYVFSEYESESAFARRNLIGCTLRPSKRSDYHSSSPNKRVGGRRIRPKIKWFLKPIANVCSIFLTSFSVPQLTLRVADSARITWCLLSGGRALPRTFRGPIVERVFFYGKFLECPPKLLWTPFCARHGCPVFTQDYCIEMATIRSKEKTKMAILSIN